MRHQHILVYSKAQYRVVALYEKISDIKWSWGIRRSGHVLRFVYPSIVHQTGPFCQRSRVGSGSENRIVFE